MISSMPKFIEKSIENSKVTPPSVEDQKKRKNYLTRSTMKQKEKNKNKSKKNNNQ